MTLIQPLIHTATRSRLATLYRLFAIYSLRLIPSRLVQAVCRGWSLWRWMHLGFRLGAEISRAKSCLQRVQALVRFIDLLKLAMSFLLQAGMARKAVGVPYPG